MHTAAQLTKAAWQLVAVYGGGTGRLTEGFLSSSSLALVDPPARRCPAASPPAIPLMVAEVLRERSCPLRGFACIWYA